MSSTPSNINESENVPQIAFSDDEYEEQTGTHLPGKDEHNSSCVVAPYGRLFHPEKTFIDVLVSFLLEFLFPLIKICAYPPSADSNDALQCLNGMRDTKTKLEKGPDASNCKKWSAASLGGLVGWNLNVQRVDEILKEWDIVEKNGTPEQKKPSTKEDVGVLVRCPASVVSFPSKVIRGRTEETEANGYETLSDIDLSSIDSSVPIIVWFHGGGMVLTGVKDGNGIEYIDDLVKAQIEHNEEKDDVAEIGAPPLVSASVDYCVAPEDPFPAAVIDGLSVVSFILRSTPSRDVHVAGQSAGANLAAVVAFECHRRFPGRIKSAFIQEPMVCPSSDTMSVYMNSSSSGCCPVDWLRWSWRAYLSLDNNDHQETASTQQDESKQDKKVESLDPMTEALRCGSNKDALERSDWNTDSKIWRLVSPQTDLPRGLDAKNAPRFIVTTATADPLHDEGVELVEEMQKQKAKLLHVDAKGSHTFGLQTDVSKKKEAIEAWRSAIWGK